MRIESPNFGSEPSDGKAESGAEEGARAVEIHGSIPEDVTKRFDTTEILKLSQESFTEHLKGAGLRTLIGYIEAGDVDLGKIDEISSEWKKKIEDIKKEKDSFTMVNPKLSFLSKRKAAELALKELMRRMEEGPEGEKM